MGTLGEATQSDITRVFDDAAGSLGADAAFEHVAQALAQRIYGAWPETVALARVFVTAPLRSLPEENARWVRQLAASKGIAAELTPATQVISLAGSAGALPAWNDRRASSGHVGIPMTSSSFIEAIPMMSRLLTSLGGGLDWIDEGEASQVVSRLGTVANIFYVADAREERDARGRRVISAEAFVAEHGVRTVFGVGGAFASGQLLMLLAFCREHVPRALVEGMRAPFMAFKTAAARSLRRVFSDGAELDGRPPARAAVEAVGASDPAALRRELAALNAAYLDLESRLEERTRALRLTLDSCGDAMMLVDFDGSLGEEPTARALQWFGRPEPGARVWDHLFGAGTSASRAFALAFSQIVDDVLPFELLAEQLPRSLTRGDTTWEIAARQVFVRERFSRVLLVLRDATERLAVERSEARARELHAVVRNVLRDRADFERFLDETAQLIADLDAASPTGLRRTLHTLKGNTAVYGFHRFAAGVHALEEDIAERGAEALDADRRAALAESWRRHTTEVHELLGGDRAHGVSISVAEHEDFLRMLDADADRRALARVARSWRDEPTATVMLRLAAQAERIAAQLGRRVDVRVVDEGRRLPVAPLREFWRSLIHAIRNAVDHGAEPPAVRVARGKDPVAVIELRCAVVDGALQVTVTDDGPGIDWEAVRDRARAANLTTERPEDLVEAVFTDGLSCRAEVHEVSGRGVGLSAIRAACRALDGGVTVRSDPGRGTSLEARVPLNRLSFTSSAGASVLACA